MSEYPNTPTTKISVRVGSAAELERVYNEAVAAKIPAYAVHDAERTEIGDQHRIGAPAFGSHYYPFTSELRPV